MFDSHRHSAPPTVRLTRPADFEVLVETDLKSYDYPMNQDEWRAALKTMDVTSKIMVLEVHRKVVGFVCSELVENTETGDSYVKVTRLGVIPGYRRLGYGSILLENAETSAMKLKADKMSILVPEIHCGTNDEDDVAAFLTANGYKTSGVIEYEYMRMYGDLIDGYYFEKEL